jgi:hypothetical protein
MHEEGYIIDGGCVPIRVVGNLGFSLGGRNRPYKIVTVPQFGTGFFFIIAILQSTHYT